MAESIKAMNDDLQLVRRYAQTGSEEAFGEIVSRHVDLVYSVAFRLAGGDAHMAQDVVQTVFLDLSMKAKRLPPDLLLAGWLARHTFFVASAKVDLQKG
jgi:DNA-directed RNA polymerase specialized sigma24 family protein